MGYKERTVSLLAERTMTQLQASSVSQSFDIKDKEGCREFAEWFVDMAETLGMIVSPNPEEIDDEENLTSRNNTRDA